MYCYYLFFIFVVNYIFFLQLYCVYVRVYWVMVRWKWRCTTWHNHQTAFTPSLAHSLTRSHVVHSERAQLRVLIHAHSDTVQYENCEIIGRQQPMAAESGEVFIDFRNENERAGWNPRDGYITIDCFSDTAVKWNVKVPHDRPILM